MIDIRLYGDPVLRGKSRPVDHVTAQIKKLVKDMLDAMRNAAGVGLAAPQVGRELRICVIQHPQFQPKALTLINPVILERAEELSALEEGCLSLPQLNVLVTRPRAIRVRYTDVRGKTVEKEFLDMLSRIVLHECDHLEGKMIVDHLDLENRLRFETWMRKKISQ